METGSFPIRNGEISFGEKGISILDDAQKRHRIRIISAMVWIFFGTVSVLRYLNTGNEFLLWTGLIIGIGYIVVLILIGFTTTRSEIPLNEIRSVKLKSRLGNHFMVIRTTDHKVRKVKYTPDIHNDLDRYVRSTFK